MEILTSILVASATEIGRGLCGCISPKIESSVRFKANLNDLEKETKKLTDLSYEVRHELESAERNGRSPTTAVKIWLRDVEEFVAKVNSVRDDAPGNAERLCGCFCRGSRQIRLGSKVGKLLKEVETLSKSGSFPNGMLSVYSSAKPVEYIPGPSIEYQTTASKNLAEFMNMLEDNNIRRIGVWGMGGVGKTTLVRNLNNKLSSASSNHPFSIVIWATVTKDLDMRRLQKQIAERLNSEVAMEDSIERTAARLYQRLEKEKFLLILDDVWDNIDLEYLGIPLAETHSGSKILLTSRSSDVCRRMMTDVEVRVEVLNSEEAWQLFCGKAGEVVSSEDIKPLAEAVARECCGLPLALITVGTAMRGKKRVEQWKHALKQLKGSVPCISGVKDKVYNSLKWSYDSLEGNNIKACFLYCALYPEDFSIEVSELLQCWLAEGLIEEQLNFEEFVNNGVFVVETLKESCLLEDGSREGLVKMHDVVRDVAIWIASSLENECKSLVRSAVGLSEISEVDFREDSLKRVSFMNNRINILPSCEIRQCSRVTTLLLQGNHQLEKVPDMFLQGFQSLKVLNISDTGIKSLPHHLQLTELRAIMLRHCGFIANLAPLGELRSLQVLDLCGTSIRELPRQMQKLINLRQVNLSHTRYLQRIEAGIVAKWKHLEVLDMSHSGYSWSTTKGNIAEMATFEELVRLQRLCSLSIKLENVPCLDLEELSTWVSRMGSFQFTFGWHVTRFSSTSRHDKRKVTMNWLNRNQWSGWLLFNASSLVWNCLDLNMMIQSLLFTRFSHARSVDSFAALKSLTITVSHFTPSLGGGNNVPSNLFPNIEELHLHDVSLQSISELADHFGLSLSNLKLIHVSRCDRMECLFSSQNFSYQIPNLETIKVKMCSKLETLFDYKLAVPNLRTLELRDLTRLESLCIPGELWPCLEQVEITDCYRLRKLPFTSENAKRLQEIRGESHWWSKLMWDDDETKSSLQSYLKLPVQDFLIEDGYSFIRRCYTPGSP